MGVRIQQDSSGRKVMRITGVLKKSELDAVLTAEARQWKPEARVKALMVVEKFKGWERGADWGDLSFFLKYDNQIEKIAIVADPKWETDLMIYAGAGMQSGQVKFFPTDQLASAQAWLD